MRQIAHDQVVALFALQHLRESVAADGRLNRVLHIRRVDLIARGGLAIHREVQVGLAEDAKQPQILDARDGAHDVDDLVALLFERLQIVAVDLDRQLSFDAADRLFHVVGDRLREIPDHAGNLVELAVHGGDQLFFVLVEHGTPLLLRLQIDEILGVEEARGIGSIVGPAHLAGGRGDFREGGEDHANLVGHADAFGGSGARRQRAAHPDGAFIQMGKELGSDGPAQQVSAPSSTRPARP